MVAVCSSEKTTPNTVTLPNPAALPNFREPAIEVKVWTTLDRVKPLVTVIWTGHLFTLLRYEWIPCNIFYLLLGMTSVQRLTVKYLARCWHRARRSSRRESSRFVGPYWHSGQYLQIQKLSDSLIRRYDMIWATNEFIAIFDVITELSVINRCCGKLSLRL